MQVEGLLSSNIDDKNGFYVYQQFNGSVVFKKWLDETDPNSVKFNNILEKMRKGKMTEADIETLIIKFSMCRVGLSAFKSRGGGW